MSRFAVLFLILLVAAGKAHGDEALSTASDFKPALERLIEQPSPGAFLIFTEVETGRFVQFAQSPEQGIQFDFPVDPLTESEISRASQYLIQLGAEFKSWQVGPDNMQAFSKFLQHDVDAAALFATTVFEKVLGLSPDARYRVEAHF